ncbi:MAG: hypothetical protein ABSD62_03325 [Candidatus Limnocylindrales bacterium]|jgi:hypothetical protein
MRLDRSHSEPNWRGDAHTVADQLGLAHQLDFAVAVADAIAVAHRHSIAILEQRARHLRDSHG